MHAGHIAILLLALNGGSASRAARADAAVLSCDDGIRAKFRPDPLTQVTKVKLYKRGQDLNLDGPVKRLASADLCEVELLVGPGNPGPPDAPSTSKGVRITVWLPPAANWNGRLRFMGGGGWSGSTIGEEGPGGPANVAATDGVVAASTNVGHDRTGYPASDPMLGYSDASFLFDPSGRVSKAQWVDYSHRGVHEMALKTKALVRAYYGKPYTYSYFWGASGGGREAIIAAQLHPADFDGIVAYYPALDLTRFNSSRLYSQVVIARDLGGVPLSAAALSLVSARAVTACDASLTGRHDGFISDPAACRYDPGKDRDLLCAGAGGSNETAACLTKAQAAAVNKVWYGETADGAFPDPTLDNGYSPQLGGRVWFGYIRGSLIGLSHADGDGTMLAINTQNPDLGGPILKNAAKRQQSAWQKYGYADLARAVRAGDDLERALGPFNADDPNLEAFRARGGKLIVVHGMADPAVPILGTTNYYLSVVNRMGGLPRSSNFSDTFRFQEWTTVMGGHCRRQGCPASARRPMRRFRTSARSKMPWLPGSKGRLRQRASPCEIVPAACPVLDAFFPGRYRIWVAPCRSPRASNAGSMIFYSLSKPFILPGRS